jgi:hypothetical protein
MVYDLAHVLMLWGQVIAYAWSSAWELPFGKYSAGDHLLLLCGVQSIDPNPGSLSCY